MTLRELLDRLGVSSQRRPGQASWQQSEEELFPALYVHRLEERRLLNAAPVAVAPAPTPKDSGTEAHTSAHAASHDQAGNDVQNLARITYGGPSYGNFSAEMIALTAHAGHGSGGHDSAKNDDSGSDSTDAADATANADVTPAATAQVAALEMVTGFGLAADQPPVNVVPGPQTTNEDTSHVITGLSVSDPDSGSNPITTQFSVNHGTLSVDTTGGVAQPSGAILMPDGTVITGNGTNTLIIAGSTSQITSELSAGLTYTPNLDYNGADQLTMTSNDLGATGSGGPLQDVDAVAIAVAAVDDPPVNVVPGPQSTNENAALVISGLSVSDVDSGSNPIITQLSVAHGTLSVDTTGGVVQPSGAILMPDGTVITGNGTSTLIITGTTAQITSELSAGLTYTPGLNYHGSDTLTMTSNDLGATGLGGPLKDVDTVAISVLQVDQPPVNVVPGPQTAHENSPLVIGGLSVSDPDSGSNPITTQFTVAHGTLSVDTTGGVVQPSGAILLPDGTVITGNGTNALIITGSTTQISNELSHGLTYTPAANYFGGDTLTMTSNDLGATGLGGPLKDIDAVAITVLEVDQPPVNAVPGPQTALENTPKVIGGLSVSDPDSGTSPITTQLTVTHGTLTVDTTGGVTQPSGAILLPDGTVITGNGTSTLIITGTTAQISNELSQGLTYTPAADYFGGDTLTVTSNDLGATGLGGPLKDTDTVAITVLQVDKPPVNVVPGPQTTNEDTPVVIGGLSVSDPDSGSSPITTQLTVSHGTLSVDTTGGVTQPSGAILMPDGTVITGNGTNTVIILGTTSQITNELSHGLTYTPTFAYFGPDTLTMKSNDLGATGVGGPLTDTDTVAITVAPVVHAPTLTVTSPASGFNGLPISIGISGALTDSNKPEVLTFNVSGVPTDAVLHDGLGNDHSGQSSYTLTEAEVAGLTLTMPDSNVSQNFDLTVVAVATDAAINQTASSAPQTISVASLNPYPILTNLSAPDVLQGSSTTLTGTLASLRPGAFPMEVTVTWGDGSPAETVQVNAQGQFSATHTYLYENANAALTEIQNIHVSVTDAFGKTTTGDTSLAVTDVPPTISNLSITPNDMVINNVAVLTGTIFDPGPADSFTMTVNWGDETAPQVIALPAGSTNFTLSHLFDDNRRGDPNQVNPVQITIVDNHTGLSTSATAITVHDVNPTLINYTGTNLGSNGILTISGNISHPGPGPLTLTINWEDTVQVIQNVPQGNFQISHFYDVPPNPADPSGPITVSVRVSSDTNLSATASNTSTVPGLGALGGSLAFFYVQQENNIPHFENGGQHVDMGSAQPIVLTFTTVQFDVRPPQGQGLADTKAVVALRTFDAEAATERGVVILPVDVLNNLTALFAKLPDDHYRLYYVEQGTERMIMDVVVRRGKPIDPTDESEGTQDRPPTSHLDRMDDQEQVAGEADEAAPVAIGQPDAFDQSRSDVSVDAEADGELLNPLPSPLVAPGPVSSNALSNVNAAERATADRYRALFVPAVAAIAISSTWSAGTWAQRVDEELTQAPADALSRPSRLRRRLRRLLDRPTPRHPR
ncbi:MAG TPA: hypothetical protein VHD36_14560 [Pirellulales bacterium]|nr:hypothetical protein [Pirellulales bacterium]